MSWNYRVIRHKTPKTGNKRIDALNEKNCPFYFAVHQVHYDEEGKIILYSEEHESAATLKELFDTLNMKAMAAGAAALRNNHDRFLDEDELPQAEGRRG